MSISHTEQNFWFEFFEMREFITGKAFKAKKRMTESFMKSRILRGGSALVETAMRSSGWDPLAPAAAATVYLSDKTGQVNSAKLVLAGIMPGFEIQDIGHIFPKATEGAAIHFGNLDLNSLKFMSSQMSTRWIPDTEFSWNLMVEGLDEQGHKSMVAVSAGNLAKHNVNNLSLRVTAQPISAEKIKISIGIAPVSHTSLKKTDSYDELGFPVIEVHTFTVDTFPQEDSTTSFGIGIVPYILDKRKEDEANVLPCSADLKNAVCDLFARSIMPSAKKSAKRWQEAIAKGDWSARESSKEWPQPLPSDDEDGDITEDVSGR